MEEGVKHEIAAMWDAGMTIPAIANELGTSAQTIRNLLKSLGKDTSRAAKKPAVDEVAVCEEYTAWRPIPEILKKHDISYTILYRILREGKVTLRKVSETEITNVRLDRAVDLYIAGSPLWAIKQETGVAQPTLHAELHKRGVTLRRPRML